MVERDAARPHAARMYDYYLGGKDWFEADREVAEAMLARLPAVRTWARANRAFMHRATGALVREYGVRQFLDLGSGIPTEPNLHQVAQEIAPETHVVYVDNDPLVVEYTDALMRGTPEGRTTYVEADVRVEDILQHPYVRDVLDFERPIALSLVALLHLMPDEEEPRGLVARLMDGLPSGSFLVLSHGSADFDDENEVEHARQTYGNKGIAVADRTRTEIARFFTGLELLSPGLVVGHRWRPDGPVELPDEQVGFYGGVARKP